MATITRFTNSGLVRTTDATITVVAQADLTSVDNCTFLFEIFVAARATSNVSKGWKLAYQGKRTSGVITAGASTLSVNTSSGDAGAAAWLTVGAVNGSFLEIQVTGAAGVTIDWYAKFDGFALQN